MGSTMRQEGWCADPHRRHEARWISDDIPTDLVRDGQIESARPPPDTPDDDDLRCLADTSRHDGSDLRRTDEAQLQESKSGVRAVLDVFDQIGWHRSNGDGAAGTIHFGAPAFTRDRSRLLERTTPHARLATQGSRHRDV